MGWMRLLSFRRTETVIDRFSREVAVRSRDAVIARLRDSVRLMSLSEARGYVRARAGQPVRRETRLVLNGITLPAGQTTDRIIRLATERVVHHVIRDLLTQPAPTTRIHKAA